MIMAGSLGEWSVDDLLQIARITQKTTSIQVIGTNRKGVVYARSGRLVSVDLEPDPRTGTDPMERLIEGIALVAAIPDGTFEFGTHEVPEGGPSMDIKEALRAVERDVLRERRLAESGIDDTQPLSIVSRISEPITLEPVRWRLLAEIVGRFSLESLEDRLGRKMAVTAILMLESGGLLERIEGGPPVPAGPSREVARLDAEQTMAEPEPEPEPEPGPESGPESESESESDSDSDSDSDEPSPSQEFASPAAEPESIRSADHELGAHIVEIFDMHEVVAPSETTLIPGVLNDMHSRFRGRNGAATYEPDL